MIFYLGLIVIVAIVIFGRGRTLPGRVVAGIGMTISWGVVCVFGWVVLAFFGAAAENPLHGSHSVEQQETHPASPQGDEVADMASTTQ